MSAPAATGAIQPVGVALGLTVGQRRGRLTMLRSYNNQLIRPLVEKSITTGFSALSRSAPTKAPLNAIGATGATLAQPPHRFISWSCC